MRYIRKSYEVEAIQWDGEDLNKIASFCGISFSYISHIKELSIEGDDSCYICDKGDFIILDKYKGYSVCSEKDFKKYYEVKK